MTPQVLKPYLWHRYSKYLTRKILDPHYIGRIEAPTEGNRELIKIDDGNKISGISLSLYLLIDTEKFRVVEVKYEVFAPTPLIGALEVLSILTKNKSLLQVSHIGADHIDNYVKDQLGQEAFPKETHAFINMAITAIDEALDEATQKGWMQRQPAVFDGPTEEIPNWETLSKEDRIAAIENALDKELRPYIALDGGGVEIVDLEDNILKIAYQGACVGCHSATGSTLFSIQSLLRSKVYPHLTVTPIDVPTDENHE